MSLFKTNPATKAPIICSTPATSARKAAAARAGSKAQPGLPIVQAYANWVNEGVRARKFARKCTFENADGTTVSFPLPLPSKNGKFYKTVFGDINRDGSVDFIAHTYSIVCDRGNAGWAGDFIIGVSQGSKFRFGKWGDSVYESNLRKLHGISARFGFLEEINQIKSGIISGKFRDNSSRNLPGYCEAYRGNSNVQRSFEFDVLAGRMIKLGPALVDKSLCMQP